MVWCFTGLDLSGLARGVDKLYNTPGENNLCLSFTKRDSVPRVRGANGDAIAP